MEGTRSVQEIFQMPDAAAELVDFFFDEEEKELILRLGGSSDAGRAVVTEADYPREFLEKEYRRGVISKTDETGREFYLNNFYGFLDVFCVSRKETYDRLPMEKKRELDDWYLDAYFDGLDTSGGCPTPDRVIPLDEMLEMVGSDPRPVYLNYCDCRSLTGECGLPRRTCITYKNGINTFVDRGLSEEIDAAQAQEVVREADRAGLMHTTMGGGICNCCGDCCYLFRVQRRLRSVGTWPRSDYIVEFDAEKCVACGKCVGRCHFGVFRMAAPGSVQEAAGVQADIQLRAARRRTLCIDTAGCVGCGLCVNTCPKGALRLAART